MEVKSVSFPNDIDEMAVSKDLETINTLREVHYGKKLGLGNFLIKVFREWNIMRTRFADEYQEMFPTKKVK